MKISCQACGAKYTIADEKVQGKIAKIRCKRCQATIVVNGPGTAAAESPGGGADAQGASYTVNIAENDQRTMGVDEIVRAYQQGLVTQETYVWTEGMDDWLPLASVPALASAVAGHASSPDASQPETGSVPAARLDGGRVRVDLFGDVDRAGAEPERPSAADDPSATMTGARNEQSVLFSLQTLSGSSTSTASSSTSAGNASADDSGLIDLAALAKAAGEQPQAASHAAAPAPMAMAMAPVPLGGPSVLGAPPILGPTMLEAPAMSGSVAPPAKGKMGLYIVIASALLGTAVVASAIIIALSSRPDPVSGGGATGGNVPGASAIVEPPPPPPPVETNEPPPPSATAAVTAAPTAPVRPRPGGGAKPTAEKPPTTTAAPPQKPPSSPSSNCGCPPGDLNCAIKCSATKKK
ncbi:MAG TPA: zinc-ribbon domain-containing protein [Polyangiaceae bacterium]|nr:zinc-ribbon domain-containing protein [Polyangiaceae bacterium]